MNEIAQRTEELKRVHAEILAMPDPQPEQMEALGEDVAELLRDTAAELSELPQGPTSATTSMSLRVLAVLAEALTTLDGDE